MRKIIEAFAVNEAKKISGYKFYSNMDKSALSEFKGFIKEVEDYVKFYNSQYDPLEVVLEIDELVNSSIGTTITLYGWNKLYTEDEFNRVYKDNKALEKLGRAFVFGKNKMKNFNSIYASTYWTAKRSFGSKRKKTIEIGPYVEITYDNNEIIDESVVSEGVNGTVTMDSVTSKKTLKELAKKYGTAKDKKGDTYVFTIQPYDDISVDDEKYEWDYLETVAVKIGDEIKNGKTPSYLIIFSDGKVDYVSKMSNVSIQ